MDEAYNLRLQRLEIEQQTHKETLQELEASAGILSSGLGEINKTLLQAKTATYTVAVVLLLQSMGIFETLKLLLFK